MFGLVDSPTNGGEFVDLVGVRFARLTEGQVVDRVMWSFGQSYVSRGGWIVTPNVDILRKVAHEPAVRDLIHGATLIVADGMPIVWASALLRTPLPERVTGASLLSSICSAAAGQQRRVYLLGGAPGVAEEAAHRLRDQYPELEISGWSPPFGMEVTTDGMAALRASVLSSGADVVFCGFGFPKQERIISELRPVLPDAWFIGCGASIAFAAGRIKRAPPWMQECGMEWLHRLVSEPRRLFRRYIISDIPFAVRLLAGAARRRRWLGQPRKTGRRRVQTDLRRIRRH